MILSLFIAAQLCLAEPASYGPQLQPVTPPEPITAQQSAVDEELFNRLLNPKPPVSAPTSLPPASRTALPLSWAALIAALGTGALLLLRRKFMPQPQNAPSELTVVARLQLAPQSGLAVVQFEDRRFLIGVGGAPPVFLTDLIDSPEVSERELMGTSTPSTTPAPSFERNLAAHRYQENTSSKATGLAPQEARSLVEELLADRTKST